MNHYNVSIKIDALNSLKEITISDSDFVILEVGNLLESICPLFVDRDYKVREASMLLFKTVIKLPGIKNKKHILIPFYELINVHLSCAMTHLLEKIQYSSLRLLDLLIENIPDLIIENPLNIFENFIDQISKVSIKGKRRVLKNDPCKLTSTQSWRYNVLERLNSMLVVVLTNIDTKSIPKNTNERFLVEIDQSNKFAIEFDSSDKSIIKYSYVFVYIYFLDKYK